MQEDNNKKIENESNKQEEKKSSKPKTGIEKLKDIGLKKVSNKTFINLENLTYLLDKDFKKLHKTKALGFIQILERDFDVDLRELRAEYLTYLNGGKSPKKEHHIKEELASHSEEVAKKQTTSHSKKEGLKSSKESESSIKIGPYILLLLAGLLGYYLFSSATDDESDLDIKDINIIQKDSTIQQEKESLIENAIKQEEQKASTQDNTEVVDEEDIDLNRAVNEMLKVVDANDSAIAEITSTDNPSRDEQAQDQTKQNTKQTKVDTNTIPTNTPTNSINKDEQKDETNNTITTLANIDSKPIPQKQEELKESQKPKNKTKKPTPTAKKGLYIKPIQKAWVGIIYLDNYTKKDFLIRSKLKLNPNRDQLILLGHNKFKIYNHGKSLPFNSTKKVRFLYQDGELIEIDKQEYVDRSAGVHW